MDEETKKGLGSDTSHDVICCTVENITANSFRCLHRLYSLPTPTEPVCMESFTLRTYPNSRVKHTRPAPLLSLTIVLTPLGVAQVYRIAAPIGPR